MNTEMKKPILEEMPYLPVPRETLLPSETDQTTNLRGRRNRQATLNFTNRDCIHCFEFVDRELHFILNEVKTMESAPKFFRDEIFNPSGLGGTGRHRELIYPEFYLIGLIKLLNNMGFTINTSARIVMDKLFKDHPFIASRNKKATEDRFYQFLSDLNIFFIGTNDECRFKTVSIDQLDITKEPAPYTEYFIYQFQVRVNLFTYKQIIAKYIESYFVRDAIKDPSISSLEDYRGPSDDEKSNTIQ